jgi:heavy metal sensor kinase
MSKWWNRRPLKLRLAVWYAGATSAVLVLLACFIYQTVEHRLRAEIDRQLHSDFDLTVSQLDEEADSSVHWPEGRGPEEREESQGWVQIWSQSGELLMSHWPGRERLAEHALPPPSVSGVSLRTVELRPGLFVRVMERPEALGRRVLIVRLFRDESGMRAALRQLMESFLLALPLTVLLCSVGGYWIAGRSLAPVAAMAAQARRITSESLAQRLPNPNPHDELGQLGAVFNDTLQRLENSFSELKRFTADASHELRTPLTALRAVGEVALRQDGSATELRETIGSMLEEAQRLNDLVELLLTLARMDSGKFAANLEPVRLAELAGEVSESLSVLAAEKQQAIAVEGDAGLEARADRLLLRQALMNLVHNAVRYAPAQTRISIQIARRADDAVIEVADQGPGIASEHLPKLFDRFYRVGTARSRAEGGHGLGLAITKCSVERQGARVEVQSEPGKGSVFRILLPA